MTELPNTTPSTPSTKSSAKAIRRTETRLEITDPEKAERVRRDPPSRMTLAEAACYCGFSPRSLRQYVRNRAISRIKIGGRILFRREQLDNDLVRLEQSAL
jgi:excisionase family DNA binding protein